MGDNAIIKRVVVVLDAARLQLALGNAYTDLSSTHGRRAAGIEAGTIADGLARQTLEVLLHCERISADAVLGFIGAAALRRTHDARHIDNMEDILEP